MERAAAEPTSPSSIYSHKKKAVTPRRNSCLTRAFLLFSAPTRQSAREGKVFISTARVSPHHGTPTIQKTERIFHSLETCVPFSWCWQTVLLFDGGSCATAAGERLAPTAPTHSCISWLKSGVWAHSVNSREQNNWDWWDTDTPV